MDDATLTQQLAKTGDLMDLFNDEMWLQEALDENAEYDGPVEAGLALKPYVEALAKVPPEAFRRQRHQVEVLSILLPELDTWLQSWNLGRSFEAVQLEVHRRLYGHMKRLIVEQADWIEALLAEAKQRLPIEQRTVRAQTTAVLAQLFTQDDWVAFSDIAATEITQGVMQARQQVSMVAAQEMKPPTSSITSTAG